MTFDEERRQFLAELAEVINEWVNLESALLRVFVASLHGAHFGCASAAYYAIVSFEAKLTMTSSVLDYRLPDGPLYQEWADEKAGLRAQIGKKARTRNRLVHFPCSSAPQAEEGRRFWLEPPLLNARAWPASTSDEVSMYFMTDIVTHRADFKALAQRIAWFAAQVDQQPALPQGPLQLRSDDYLRRLQHALTPQSS
jgi:hypothetical protein